MKLPNKKTDFLKWYSEVIAYANIVDNRSPVKGSNVIMPYGYSFLSGQKEIGGLKHNTNYLGAW